MSGAANSRIDVTFPTGTTFAGYVSATVRNLTTATNVGSCGNASRPRDPVLAVLLEHDRRRPQRRDHLQRHHQPAHGVRRQAGRPSRPRPTRRPSTPRSSPSSPRARSPRSPSTTRRRREPPARARSTSSASPPPRPAAACPAPPTAASTSPSPPAPPSPATSAPPCATSPPPPTSAAAATRRGLVIQCSLVLVEHDRRRPQRHASPSTASPTRPRRHRQARSPSPPPPTRRPSTPRQFTVVAASPITAVTVDNTNPSRAAGARTQLRRRLHHLRDRRRHVRRRQQPHRRHLPHRHHLRRLHQRHRPQPHHRHRRRQLRQPHRPRDPVLALLLEHDRRRPQRHDHLQRHHQPALPGHRQPRRVSTTSDPQTVDSAQFDVVAGQSLTAVTVEPGSTTASATTPYVVRFVTSRLGRPLGRRQQPDRDHVPRRGDVRRLHERDGPRRDGAPTSAAAATPADWSSSARSSPRPRSPPGHASASRSPASRIRRRPAPTRSAPRRRPTCPRSRRARTRWAATRRRPRRRSIGTSPFTFASSEPGSTFECSIDGGAVHAVHVAVHAARRARSGEHTFSVRAIDAAGNADATPATRGASSSSRRRADRRRRPDPDAHRHADSRADAAVQPDRRGRAGRAAPCEVCPKGGKCFTLEAGQQIPMGSTVDTKKGAVELTSLQRAGRAAADGACSPTASSGSASAATITDLTLTEPLAPCSEAGASGGEEAQVPQAVGRRDGQVPDGRQLQRGDGPRHPLAHAGHVRGHAHARHRGRRVRARQRQAQDRASSAPGKQYTAKPRR